MNRSHTRITAAAAFGAATFVAGVFAAGNLSTSEAGPDRPPDDPALVAAGAAEPGTGSSVDSCTLITEAEASGALGAEVAVVPNPTQCTYVAMDGSARALSITVPDYSANKQQFAAGVEQAAHALEGSFQEVGAGDEGYAIISPMVSEGLARVGDTYVVVVLTKAQGTAAEQASKLDGLLQTAFGRL